MSAPSGGKSAIGKTGNPKQGKYYYEAAPKNFQSHLGTAVLKSGFPTSWMRGIAELVGLESSWNPGAKNKKSSAYGYGQLLKDNQHKYSKKTGMSYHDPIGQLVMMMHYVKDRYKTPALALAHWYKNNWY